MPASSEPPEAAPDAAADVVTVTATLPSDVALHARPAAGLVRAASKLPTPVTLAANGKRANARSILEVLGLGATGGTEVTISAAGPDAAQATAAIAGVIADLHG